MSHDHSHSHSHNHEGDCAPYCGTRDDSVELHTASRDHGHDHNAKQANKPKDLNDYSRFDGIDDDEDDIAFERKKEDFHKAPFNLPEAVFAANACKTRGNELFAQEIYHESIGAYDEGIKILEPFKELAKNSAGGEPGDAEVRAALIALHGNTSMVHLKDKKFHEAIFAASRVLVLEPLHSKCLYRRAAAHHQLHHFDEARQYLGQLLEAEPGNAAARKELQEVGKSEKEYNARQRKRYGGMFGKEGSDLYGDKEEERLRRERKAREREDFLMDQYTQDKIVRRDRGLDEIAFEEFRKRQDDEEAAVRKELDEKLPGLGSSTAPAVPHRTPPPSLGLGLGSGAPAEESASEYDEEDKKIIEETAKKGYCYFRSEQKEDVKRLIGDIAPQAIGAPQVVAERQLAEGPSSSAWNYAGTFEEKDCTSLAKDKVRAYLKHVRVELPEIDFMSDRVRDKFNLDEQTTKNSSSAQITDRLQEMARMLCSVSAAVTGVSRLEGEAQIIHSRGKRKSLFDFGEIVVDFNVQIVSPVDVATLTATHVQQSGKEEDKVRLIPGTLSFRDFSNDSSALEHKLAFKKHVPSDMEPQVRQAAALLAEEVCAKLREFQRDYESSA